MGTVEIILGALLCVICLALVAFNIMKNKSEGGLNGASTSSAYMKNKTGNEKDQMLTIGIWVCIASSLVIAVALNYMTMLGA